MMNEIVSYMEKKNDVDGWRYSCGVCYDFRR